MASPGEYNLARFFSERPELVERLGVVLELARDDAEVALQLAPAVGRYKKKELRQREEERSARASSAARQLVLTARHRPEGVELDADLLLGDLLADNHREYISFEIPGGPVPVRRLALSKARAPLRNFIDVAAFVDEQGLHLRWRGGRGGLNYKAQVEERGAEVLHVDLRPRPPVRRILRQPVLLAEVLADLGLT